MLCSLIYCAKLAKNLEMSKNFATFVVCMLDTLFKYTLSAFMVFRLLFAFHKTDGINI